MNNTAKTHIKNPETNRLIRIGGRTYNDLVRNNLLKINKNEVDNKVVFEGETKEELDTVGGTIKEYETKLNPPSKNKYYAQRGNKIVERKKTISRVELTNDIQRRCLDLYLKHKHLFTNEMKKEEIQSVLNQLLHKDLAGMDTSVKKKTKYVVGKTPKSNFYQITETDLDTDFTETEIDTESDSDSD